SDVCSSDLLDDDGFLVLGEQGAGVGEHDRVVVHVHDPGVPRDPLGDLVDVVLGGQARADVQELPDARLGELPHAADEEAPVGQGHLADVGAGLTAELDHLLGGFPVGGEVVLAAQVVVVHTGHTGHGGINLPRKLRHASYLVPFSRFVVLSERPPRLRPRRRLLEQVSRGLSMGRGRGSAYFGRMRWARGRWHLGEHGIAGRPSDDPGLRRVRRPPVLRQRLRAAPPLARRHGADGRASRGGCARRGARPGPSPGGLVTEVTGWLASGAVPLDGLDPRAPVGDLEPLRAALGGVRVVGLGEATHGTREFFLLKHRLLRFLVEEMGFTVLAMEASASAAEALDVYVQGGAGEPERLLADLGFWTWRTREMLAVVEWMRAHNRTASRKVRFAGIDPQFPAASLRWLRDHLGERELLAPLSVLEETRLGVGEPLDPAIETAARRLLEYVTANGSRVDRFAEPGRVGGATATMDAEAHARIVRQFA